MSWTLNKRYDAPLLAEAFSPNFEKQGSRPQNIQAEPRHPDSSQKMQVLYSSQMFSRPGPVANNRGANGFNVYPQHRTIFGRRTVPGRTDTGVENLRKKFIREPGLMNMAEVHDLGPGEMVLLGCQRPNTWSRNEDCLKHLCTNEH